MAGQTLMVRIRSVCNERRLRLISGVVLLVYVSSHLLNLALANVSVAAADDWLGLVTTVWHSIPGTAVLGAAFAVHLCLGLVALYERRHFEWSRIEIVQQISGQMIPLLLMNHIMVTRIAELRFGLQKGYVQELHTLYGDLAGWGAVQMAVLVVAWLHGCIGAYFWLRLKSFYQSAAPWLLAVACVLPTLALLGFYAGGRAEMAAEGEAAFRAVNLDAGHVGTAAQVASLVAWRWTGMGIYTAVVVLVFAARGLRVWREHRRGVVRINYADGPKLRVPIGLSILEASRRHRVQHASVCGGRGRCSTCRILVLEPMGGLEDPSAVEAQVLRRIGAGTGVRLACQLRPRVDMSLMRLLSPRATAADGRRNRMRSGEERFVVAMFVDLRGSTQMAEHRLPFDTVFTINRFLAAVGRAVRDNGGQPNNILGDGMLVLFGLDRSQAEGCRDAVRAAAAIGENMRELNRMMEAGGDPRLAFGIGIHAGEAIVGEVGFEDHSVVTALGDVVNTAARMQDLTKEFACELLVSDGVWRRTGWPADGLVRHSVLARGRSATLDAYAVATETLIALTGRVLAADSARR